MEKLFLNLLSELWRGIYSWICSSNIWRHVIPLYLHQVCIDSSPRSHEIHLSRNAPQRRGILSIRLRFVFYDTLTANLHSFIILKAYLQYRPTFCQGPLINDMISAHCLDILTTHIRPNDTDALLKSVTPACFKLHHKPQHTRRGGG